METNKEHFFGDDKSIMDSVMLLTYDDHPRKECRLFQKVLKEMTAKQMVEWLNSPRDSRFNW